MSIALITTRNGYRAAGLAVLALVGCGPADASRRLPSGYRLVQKQRYQALYAPDGRIQRLLEDRDEDGRADAVVLYGPDGSPARGELDTDGDGRVDRWEYFTSDRALEKVDLDTDGDGRVDRTDYAR